MAVFTLPSSPCIHLNVHETLFPDRPAVRPRSQHQYSDEITRDVSSLATVKRGSNKSKPGKVYQCVGTDKFPGLMKQAICQRTNGGDMRKYSGEKDEKSRRELERQGESKACREMDLSKWLHKKKDFKTVALLTIGAYPQVVEGNL